ncbi:hypothetical protein [Pseudomonas typographi]|uniref:Transposase n=1 Tax=Pseudomonas typographi TaxID=2715964 RepID=A0ABR7ZAB7_9PSED|nr:hypothetical protein [Pseudomonas typographi]MBD1554263.1 hypothetical protein [Pseudomonas typographi]MBD1602271.1 hypothetical protein [Pseudomonas typographi]
MSCLVSFQCTGPGGKVVQRGTAPKKPSLWNAQVWFILPCGDKFTHSITVPGQTVRGMIPYMEALFDSLAADHGNQVRAAGWTATSHGR